MNRAFSALALLALAALCAASPARVLDRGQVEPGAPVEGRLGSAGEAHSFKIVCQAEPAPFRGPVRATLSAGVKAQGYGVALLLLSADAVPTPDSYSWAADADGQFRLGSDDAAWPASGVFYVSLVGVAPTSYVLETACSTEKVHAAPRAARAASAGAPEVPVAPLTLGRPVNGTATLLAPAYFSVSTGASANCNLTVSLAGLEGDPDLYASVSVQYPSPTNWTYRSMQWGDDSILVPGLAAQTTLNIAVVSFTATSSFTLVASQTCSGSQVGVQLQNGVPVAASGQQSFYITTTSHSGALTIEVSPVQGDPDVFVAVNRPVTASNYDWSARAWGADSITILPTDRKYCSSGTCQYNILVVPFGSQPAVYSVTATFGSGETELQAGVPYGMSGVGGEMVYFRFTASLAAPADLTIGVTAVEGDPDLFVGTGNVTRPSGNLTTWSSRMVGSDFLTVPSTDPRNCASCTFIIGVQCYGSAACAYTVQASFGEPTELLDGEPVNGQVGAGAFAYFLVEAQPGPGQNLTLTLTPVSGSCSMYEALGTQPTRSHYDSVTHWYDTDQQLELVVPSTPCNQDDPNADPVCVFNVGVSSYVNCSFTVSAVFHSARSEVRLLDGVPFASDLQAHAYDYYRFENLAATGPLVFRVTALAGDPDLFVTFPPHANPQPSLTVHNASSSNYGNDEVTVSPPAVGTYYAAVYGFSNTSYTITAYTSQAVTLEEGVPFQVQLSGRVYSYFVYNAPAGHGDMHITASCVDGSANMYVSATVQSPTSSHFDYSGVDSITVPSASVRTGQYFLGLYASFPALCVVTATSMSSPMEELEEGVPARGHLALAGQSVYYRYHHVGFSSVRFILTPEGTTQPGDTDLYISVDDQYPNVTNNNWYSNTFATEVVVIEPTDSNYCYDCDFFLGAYAYTANCTYSVVADEVDVTYLSIGSGQRDTVLAGQYSYFNLYTLTTATSLTITVQLPIGTGSPNVDLLVNRGTKFPSESQFTWKAPTRNSAARVTIDQPNHPSNCDSFACVYKIAVFGSTEADFVITATQSH